MDKKYILDTEDNKKFLNENYIKLLKFGEKFPSPGGAAYYLSDTGEPLKHKALETWITARMLHVYSIGYMLNNDFCLKLAECALKGLSTELYDDKSGGWYAGLTPSYEVIPGKQCYAHAFVMLSASSAYKAGILGADKLLKKAIQVYDKYFWDEEEGLATDFWNTDFTVNDTYRGLNANMHSVEAFLAVSDVLKSDTYKKRAERIIDRVVSWAKDYEYRLPEHFTDTWTPVPEMNKDNPADPFKPYGATPGHGIEWARLIVQFALSASLSEEKKSFYIDVSEQLYNRAVLDAWCINGIPGFFYTTDWSGKPVVKDRMHWTLAEAINTSAVLYRVTKKEKYKSDYAEYMKYLDEIVIDKKNGSWFHELDENNVLKGDVWPGKPDIYHAFQAMLIPYLSPDTSISMLRFI